MNNDDKSSRDRETSSSSSSSSSSTTRVLHFNSTRVVGISAPAGARIAISVGDIVGVRITGGQSEPLIDSADLLHAEGEVIPSITLKDGRKIDLTDFLLSECILSNYNNSSNLEAIAIAQSGKGLIVTTVYDFICSGIRTHSFTLNEILVFEAWARDTKIEDANILRANGKVIPSITLKDKTKIDLTDLLLSRSCNLSNLKEMVIGKTGMGLRIYMSNGLTDSLTLTQIVEFDLASKGRKILKNFLLKL